MSYALWCTVITKRIALFPLIKNIEKGVMIMATPKVDMDLCIGCGLCSELCPKVFELRDDKAWVINPNACDTCDCQQAVDSCPVTAIAME
jgi:ferredoxin